MNIRRPSSRNPNTWYQVILNVNSPEKQKNRDPWVYGAGAVLAAAVLVWDLNHELGLAGGVPYILVVLLGFWARSRRVILHLALVCSILTVVGWYFSPSGGEAWKVAGNRFLALLAIWVTAFLCVMHHNVKRKLEESRAALDTIFHAVPAMIWYKDRENRILRCNRAAAEMLGGRVQDFENKRIQDVFPQEAAAYYQDDLEVIRSGQPKLGIVQSIRTAHGPRWIRTDKIPYRDEAGNIQGVIVFALDITEIREARHQLELLSTAIDQSPTAIMITDSQGVIQYVNPSFCRNSGYTPGELLGRTPRLLKSGEHPPEFYKELWRTLLAGEVWRGEFQNRNKNGTLMTELVSIHPIRNAAGEITHFVWVKVDDVERRQAEKKLREYARELARSNQDLEEFASIASHDLQEPLRKIVAFGEKLKGEDLTRLDDRGQKYLDRMIQASRRLQNLVQDLISLARVSHLATPLKSTDLNRVVDEVLVDLELEIEESGARIEKGRLPWVEANPTQMRQLFFNLIGNALKFRRKGVPPVIRIESREREGGQWEISISDNGIGFDEKYLEKIFKPFERLHTYLEGYEGSGIGLALCRKIVEAHEGVIWARSRPGQGSTFTIRLPASQSFSTEKYPV